MHAQPAPSAYPGHRAVGLWLVGVALLLALMVIVGGATRLTESGLSITEWRPVTGALPPLSQAAWEAEFDKYKQIPEYQLINRGMGLEAFKAIYWWEWGHRLLGRLIGLVFLVPMVWFAVRRRLPRALILRLGFIFVLGGLQGALGWYMVKSGLVERVDVSQYRLAAHLGLAFFIFGLTIWTALDVLRGRAAGKPLHVPHALPRLLSAFALLVYVQIFLGALVAGLRAGLRYNTWPLMEGRFVPDGAMRLSPWFKNFFENQGLVQFDHRIGAYLVFAGAIGLGVWAGRRLGPSVLRTLLLALMGTVFLQFLIGIWTLVAVVPVGLGLLHQAGALAVFGLSLAALHYARRPEPYRQAEPAPSSGAGVPIRSSGSGSSPL